MTSDSHESSIHATSFHELSFSLYTAETVEEVLKIARIGATLTYDRLGNDGQRTRFTLALFERARTLTIADPEAAISFMEEFLLTDLIGGDGQTAEFGHKGILRDSLKLWVEQYEFEITDALRNVVLDKFSVALRARPNADVIQAIGYLGIDREDTSTLLWLHADRAGNAGSDVLSDLALSALSKFSITEDQRRTIIDRTLAQFARPLSQNSTWTIGRLARSMSATDLELAIRTYDTLADDDNFSRRDGLLWMLGNAAREHSNNTQVQRLILDTCTAFVSHPTLSVGLALRSYVWSECQHREVPSRLIRFAIDAQTAEGRDSRKPMTHREHLWLLRAQECLHPVHLEGWRDPQTMAQARQMLAVPACQSSGDAQRARMETEGSRHKQQAWRLLMRCGLESAIHWLDEAIDSEPSAFVQHAILETAAGLPFDELPKSLERIITSADAATHDDDYSRDSAYFAQSAAIECAELISTRNSLRAIASTTLNINGNALTSAANALSTVSVSVAEASPEDSEFVIEHLLSKLNPGVAPWQRPAAARALAEVLAKSSSEANAQRLWDLIQRFSSTNTDMADVVRNYVHEHLISAIATQGKHLPSEARTHLLDVASESSTEAAWRAIDALLTLGIWDANTPDVWLRIEEAIHSDGGVEQVVRFPGSPVRGWAAHCLGRLYTEDPARAILIVEAILRTKSWPPLEQLRPHLLNVFASARAGVSEQRRLQTGRLAEALFERARGSINSFQAETVSMSILATVDQKRFRRLILDYSDAWMPGARASAAAALRVGPTTRFGIETLANLAVDKSDEVRDAAIVSLAVVAPSVLTEIILAWNASPDWRWRRRSVLAAAALDRGSFNEDNTQPNADPICTGIYDAEPRVRDAVSEALRVRQQRAGADHATAEIILGVHSNRRPIDLWHFGDCLLTWGTASHGDRLSLLLREVSNVRTRWWLIGLTKGIKDRLNRIASKREPSAPTENVHSQVVEGGSTRGTARIAVIATLGRDGTSQESRVTGWGGIARALDEQLGGAKMLTALQKGLKLGLVLEGDLSSEIHGSRVASHSLFFRGTGPYPDSLRHN